MGRVCRPLGRIEPPNFEHVEARPLLGAAAPTLVERRLPYRRSWKRLYDQGREGACVGFASSEMMSVLNGPFYDAFWLYHEAQKRDHIAGAHEGTTVHAAMEVLCQEGHRRLTRGVPGPVKLEDGILSDQWATSIDEIRAAISRGVPVTMGTNWYSNFDTPHLKRIGTRGREYHIGEGSLGNVRGGHSWCIVAASDRRQAFLTPNSWGLSYPSVWIPYTTVQRLLRENGEAAVVVDRT